jgi:acyl-coenzyme A synthetase/AMP-(fatty) acid ligase
VIPAAIHHWTEVQPDKTAVDYNDESWSYRAFSDAIARARGHFSAAGLKGPGVAIVAIGRYRDWWVASLALRSLGLTTVVAYSPDMILALSLADVRAVVTTAREAWPGLAEACAELGAPHIDADASGSDPLPIDPTAPMGGHVLFTSGTTGVHKRVLMDPAFEAAFMRRRLKANGINHDSVVSVIDFGPWTGVGYKSPAGTWFCGGTVVFSQGRPVELALQRPDLTECTLLPGMLATLLATPPAAFPYHERMNLGITGGPITQAQIDQAKARISPILMNGLGATESNAIAITFIETPDDHRWQVPTEGVIQIVDEEDRPLRPGHIGRLRIDTDNAPKAYLDDEEATRAFFRDGFFYPGDLAVQREDGRIALMGRVSDVINVAGQKISPAPIEERLCDALGATGVCLASMQDAAGEEALHAIIETPAPIPADALAAALRSAVAGFPGVHVHFVPTLPRNEAGKVLRHKVAEQLAAATRRQSPR